MDLNLVVLAGRLAAPPEIRRYPSGEEFARYLVTVRSERPQSRVDVLAVTTSPNQVAGGAAEPGRRVWVAGALRRRFWQREAGRRSQLEIVAHHIEIRDESESEPSNGS